jgi:hypothetical protein
LWTLGFDLRYVLWEAMMLENMCGKQPTCLLGHGLILSGNEMCHLAKSIHHHHDGIKAPWWGQAYYEIHGHIFPRPFRNWQRLQQAYLLFVKCSILLVNQASLYIFLRIIFQVGPIVKFLEECCGAFYTTMARKRPIITFFQNGVPHLPFQHIKSILLVPQ